MSGEEEKAIEITVVKSSFDMPKQKWILKPGEYFIGRFPTNDIVLPDPYVSRKHARIFFSEGKWYIEDLNSTNGTIVNNEDIRGKGSVELGEDVEIILGLTVLKVGKGAREVEEAVEELTE